MSETVLRSTRKRLRLTQQQAAMRVGISQPYFALLESGKRPLSPILAQRFVRKLKASPSLIPCQTRPVKLDTPELIRRLSALGYPGFASTPVGRPQNPAEVVFQAISFEVLDPRITEALPWVLLHHPEMDHAWLLNQVRLNNLSNRLGFAVSLALHAAEHRNQQPTHAYRRLQALQVELRKSRLDFEDTFGNATMSDSERKWVRENRSPDARYWHILADWRPEHLQYV